MLDVHTTQYVYTKNQTYSVASIPWQAWLICGDLGNYGTYRIMLLTYFSVLVDVYVMYISIPDIILNPIQVYTAQCTQTACTVQEI